MEYFLKGIPRKTKKVFQDITFDSGQFGQQGRAQSIALDQDFQMNPTLVPESVWIKSYGLEYFWGIPRNTLYLKEPARHL